MRVGETGETWEREMGVRGGETGERGVEEWGERGDGGRGGER